MPFYDKSRDGLLVIAQWDLLNNHSYALGLDFCTPW